MELPRVEELYQRYRDKGFGVVAVEALRDTDRAKKFIADKKLTFAFLENGTGDAEVVARLYGVGGFPTSFLLDREGKIVFSHLGFEDGDEKKLEEEILKLLEKQ
ncbi:MAG: peroxiredoxin family protein [Thermoanaerobaculaceae bacterium]